MPSKPSNPSKRSGNRYTKNVTPPKKYESDEATDDDEVSDDSINDYEYDQQKDRKTEEKYPTFLHVPSHRPPSPSYQKYDAVERKTTNKRKNLKKNELSSGKVIPDYAKRSSSGAQNNTTLNVTSSRTQYPSAWVKSTITPFLLIILLFVGFRYFIQGNKSNIDISSIKVKFPQQDQQFWHAIVTGINATVHEKYPTSYLFLFESEAEETTKELLKEVSKYAVCELSECGSSAINFQEVLKSSSLLSNNDYGSVLSHLKSTLENNGLMIVENLDEVPEKFALAFHNFCDEVSPLVKKSAFFFTMKVDKFNKSIHDDLRYTEEVLHKKWMNLEEDQFVPLFTRISGMLLRVFPKMD